MSNKKNPKKNPPKNSQVKTSNVPEKAETKNSTKFIIIAAAVIVVVAAVLVGIFVVKPAIEKGKEENTTLPVVTTPKVEGERYTYADYKGTKMPVEFVEILNQAELDSKNACAKHGIALTLGDTNISKSEFVMYYLDQYRLQMYEIQYSIDQRGANMTGYDTKKLPEEQMAVGVDYTFAEDFTRKAIDAMQINYASFELAVQNGTQLTESEIAALMSSYGRIEEYAKYSETPKTADEMISDTYGAGTTYAMFAAREIMQEYALKHEEITNEKYFNAIAEEDVKAKLSENETKYKVIKARVYPIEGEYDPVEISKIKTEQEFLDFAQNNYPGENFTAQHKTNCHFNYYSALEKTFGYEVAEWAFSEDRVPGEIGLIQGQLYEYLVYIETPAFFDTSCSILTYEYVYPEGLTDEEYAGIADDLQLKYETWGSGEMTEDEVRQAMMETGLGYERTYRTGDIFFYANSWILDENRKSGETKLFNDGETVYIVYYCHNNPEDFDWNVAIRNEMSAERYNREYDVFVQENFEAERKDNVINQAWKTANVRITKNMNEEEK